MVRRATALRMLFLLSVSAVRQQGLKLLAPQRGFNRLADQREIRLEGVRLFYGIVLAEGDEEDMLAV